MDEKISVIVAEDERAYRRALVENLMSHADIEVLGEASNGEELVGLCGECAPNVAVVDIRMPVMDGIEAARILRARQPSVKILVLTTFDDDEYLRDMFAIGIDGYLLKPGGSPQIAEAVRGVYNGFGAVDGGVSRKLGNLLAAPPKSEQSGLTEAEKRVASLILDGKYNKDIADTLDISYGRVRNIVSKIYTRMGAVDREDLVDKLEKEGLPL